MGVPSSPPYLLISVVATIVILILVAVAVAKRQTLKKHKKAIAIFTLIVVAATSIGGLVWLLEPSIEYGIHSAYNYPRTGDNYFTITCENVGHISGTFSLTVRLTNAKISASTTQQQEQPDQYTAKFTYTLQPGEKRNTDVRFSINDNFTDFYIWWRFQPSSFLMKSDSTQYITEHSYHKEQNSDNFVETTPPYPP